MKKILIVLSLVLLLAVSCTSTKAVSESQVIEAPAPTETVIASEAKGLPFGTDLSADAYWRQVVCSPAAEAQAVALAGKNVVVLADDALVAAAVKTGQFLVGILPVDAEVPEGCAAQAL